MVRQKCILNCWLIWIVTGYVAFSRLAWADAPCIAVLYPQVREPYRAVLEEIITGIEQGADGSVRRFPIADSAKNEDVEVFVARSECRALIGLGRAGMQAAEPFASQIPVVAGAVLMQPGQVTVIPTVSFVPDPAELFTRLKHFFPGVKTVTIVFDPKHSRGLVEQAIRSADGKGIRINALEARDLRDAAILYERVLETNDPKTDAIWLIRDASVMDSGAILTLVLERAWRRKLVVFSSQLTHVKHGVLFSVYPDNAKLGVRLAKLAQKCALETCDDHGVMTLRELDTAVNIRTARRLGIHIDRRRDPYANLVLPAN